jgi:hypothetical protein
LIKVFKGGKYMPKVKTLLITVLVIAFALSLTGCGMLLSRRAEPELAASLDGELPEWLLLSHRSEESFAADEVLNPKDSEEEEEEEIAIGGADEDDGVTAPSSEQVASTQPAQQQTQQPAEEEKATGKYSASNPPPAGTREYMAWFALNGATGSYSEEYVTWYAQTAGNMSFKDWKEYTKAQEESESWTSGFGSSSPSGMADWFKESSND